MPEVSLDAFVAAHADSAYVLDVRELDEYHSGHVPGAVMMPVTQLPLRLSELPQSPPVYVICGTGNRSRSMAEFLVRAGFNAYFVGGGTFAWARAGHPIVYGGERHPDPGRR